jgi:ribonuclease-3
MLPEFCNPRLLIRALTHASYANEHISEGGYPVEDNERLEFLGDAILDFIAAAWLFERFPDVDEGRLTTLRAALVRATTLSRYAESIGIPERLRLGRGEKEGGGRQRANIMGDAFEAVLGALYIDQGYDAVYSYFAPILEDELNHILDENRDRDAKSQFQEWSQSNLSVTPRYRLASTEGPDHAKVFTVQVWIGDAVAAVGTGSSKQVAEQQAARSALAALIAQRQQAGQAASPMAPREAGDETREAAAAAPAAGDL